MAQTAQEPCRAAENREQRCTCTMCNAGLGTLCSDLESFVPDEGVTMIGRARSGAIAVLCSCGHCSGILAKTAA